MCSLLDVVGWTTAVGRVDSFGRSTGPGLRCSPQTGGSAALWQRRRLRLLLRRHPRGPPLAAARLGDRGHGQRDLRLPVRGLRALREAPRRGLRRLQVDDCNLDGMWHESLLQPMHRRSVFLFAELHRRKRNQRELVLRLRFPRRRIPAKPCCNGSARMPQPRDKALLHTEGQRDLWYGTGTNGQTHDPRGPFSGQEAHQHIIVRNVPG
mmetsp:Transcript_61383/g.179411  ORF Transcript_61383/g.179411 Transcript_61383/m.179411 type:complete len:209 (-) Transcript_61383:646-1272(-)